MATGLERLVVQLSADVKKYENALRKAQNTTNKQLGAIQRRVVSANNSIGDSLAGIGRTAAVAFAAIGGGRELIRLSEAATRIDNSLKVAGLSGAELEKVYSELSKAAVANGAPIETLAQLYGKAAQAQSELGVTSEELIKFTGNVALALRVAGTDAQTASGALLQLGQALGSGRVQAEEFNSILEGAPTIAKATAAGLKEAGGSVSELKKLVVDGKISSEAFFRAFEAGSVVLEQQAKNATFTLAQSMTNLNTALIDTVREFNNATGASEFFAGGINNAAEAIANFDVSGLIENLASVARSFREAVAEAEIFKAINEATGVTEDGTLLNPNIDAANTKIAGLERELELLQQRIEVNSELGFDNAEALARIGQVRGELAALRAEAANMPAEISSYKLVPGQGVVPVESSGTNNQMGGPGSRGGARRPVAPEPVSIKDFKAPPGKSGSGRSKKDSYASEIQQIKERTAALQAETAAQAAVNPLVNDYGYAVEFARVKQELLTAAQKEGKAITPELAASIEQLAAGYATASVEAQRLQESQDAVRQAAEDFKSTSKDIVSGFISDLRQGKSAAEALAGALNKVADKLIDVALNAAFGLGGGGGGGGILGGLFSLFGFAKGGYTGNGGKYQPAGIVHKGEYVFDKETTKRIGPKNLAKLAGYANGGLVGSAPSLPAMPGTRSRQQQVGVSVGVSVDNDGNLQAYVKEVSQREVSTAAPKIVAAANQNVVPTVAKYQTQKSGGDWRGR